MLHTSGVPGSVFLIRFGSVTAGRSFTQISSGDSRRPIVLPIDFDIFPWPSSPRIFGVDDSSASHSGKIFPHRWLKLRAIRRVQDRPTRAL